MLTAFHSQVHAQCVRNASAEKVHYVEPQEDRTFLWPPEVWHIPPGTPCIYIYIHGHVGAMGEESGYIGSCWGNRREGDHWGDLGVNGWIILGWISRRWDVGIWTGLGWPRIETSGGRW